MPATNISVNYADVSATDLVNQRLRKTSFPLVYGRSGKTRYDWPRATGPIATASQTSHGPISRVVVKHQVDRFVRYAGVSYRRTGGGEGRSTLCPVAAASGTVAAARLPPLPRLARFYTRPHPRRKTGRRRSPALARSLAKVYRKTTGRIASPGPVNKRTRSRRSKVRVEEEIRS